MRKGTVAARLDSRYAGTKNSRDRRGAAASPARTACAETWKRCPSTLILPRVCHPAFPEKDTRGAMSSAKVARASCMAASLTIIRAVGSVLDPTKICLLYTSDAADEEDSVDLGGRRI